MTIQIFFHFRFGTKHIVATNSILWLRTLIKESVHEIIEMQEEAADEESLVSFVCRVVNKVL